MRIISGRFRGRIIPSPKEPIVKPTLDRIKENEFNILQRTVIGARVLDLFCGSGALGLECLSRGSKEVVFVDNNKQNILSLQKFLEKIGAEGYTLLNCDYYDALRQSKEPYDIIFLDPPFDSDLAQKAILKIFKFGLLSNDGVIVWEHPRDMERDFVKDKIMDTRAYGTVEIDFIKLHNKDDKK